MYRKAPPPKKRHTKPCKFFQVDRCPYSADVCDFAHITASPSEGVRDSDIYHYNLAGSYTQDALCRYRYGLKGPSLKPLASADSPHTKNYLKVYPHRDTTPILDDVTSTQSWPSSAFPSKMTAESPSFTPPPESITTSSTSMSTSDLDEVVIVTNDPKYDEHPHSHQSQVHVEDGSPVIHVPPFSPFSPFSPLYQLPSNGVRTVPYSYEYSYMYGKSLDPLEPHSSTKSLTKQKNIKYKSKPCRFFATERGCPKGSSCTFIHDESQHEALSPVKESDPKKENSRKNYFPVPWRVIGGGVRVGIKPEDPDPDSAAASSNPFDSTSKLDKGIPPPRVISRKRSNSNPPTPSPHSQQFKVEHLFSAESPGVL